MKKKHLFTGLLLIVLLFFTSCEEEGTGISGTKGLVQFKNLPSGNTVEYQNNHIFFAVSLQLNEVAGDINISMDVHLMEGNDKINEGKVRVNNNADGGLGLFWESDESTVDIDGDIYSGKTITVYLDPDNEYTNDQFTTSQYIDLYKKATIVLP